MSPPVSISQDVEQPLQSRGDSLSAALRYVKLFVSVVRISLARGMIFRTNFVVQLCTHVLWFAVTLGFFEVIFLHANAIGEWDKYRYLVFLGTFLTINATVNTLFIGGCVELTDLIRTGNLDFALLKPVDEQFLLTCCRFDWALAPQIAFGLGMVGYGSAHLDIPIDLARIATYAILVAFGVAILYSLLLMLASLSFWTIQHRELFELWFLLLQFGNYPDEIYRRTTLGLTVGPIFTYILPIIIAINVPAKFGAALLSDFWPIVVLGSISTFMLVVSRSFFKVALKHYRSVGS
jgi:ABC-2 type transport system permease protein